MKKLLSVILAIVMIVSAVPMAFALDCEEIELGEVLTITAPNYDTEFCYIKFVADKDMKLIFKSLAYNEFDPVCELYDADMSYINYNDDYSGLDFSIEYDFVEGETYYFAVAVYDAPATFDVTLICAHSFDDAVCTVCGLVCDHETGTDKCSAICECGQNFEGIEMADGTEYVIEFELYNNEPVWGRFIPEESGVYCIESIFSEDTHDNFGTLYDEYFDVLCFNDDYDDTMMFRILCYLEAGETYFIECETHYEDDVVTIKAERVKHTTDDGAVHTDMSLHDYIDSTCVTNGYSEGVFCNECEEYIIGHEEYELNPFYHRDDNWDGICDDCGEVFLEMCDHICHSENPFLAFIWRIANVIHRIFGISAECECGEWHYYDESEPQ